MKHYNLKFTVVIITILFIIGCTKEPFTGYVVYKQCLKAHWSNEEPQKTCEFNVFDFTLIAVPDLIGANWEKTNYKVWIANRENIRAYDVDSLSWFTVKCGDKVTYDYSCSCVRKLMTE